MQRLYDTYKDHAEFFLVYIREAHPDSVLFTEKDGTDILQRITQTNTLGERSQTALTCSASLNLSIPTVVDKEDNAVNEVYAGWPDRIVIVGVGGNIAYYGGEGPRGFKPKEAEQWLRSFAETELEIPVWPDVAPGSEASTHAEEYRDRQVTDGTDTMHNRSVAGVTKPTLTVYLPNEEKATGVLVVVCPGGGFSHLAIDKEGHDVAGWLQSQGIACAVLKYRLPDLAAGLYVRNGSIPDTERAIRLVRHHALTWNIDPQRIGVMGFSAGGYLAAAAGTMFDHGDPNSEDPVDRLSSRPNFISPVYPLVSLELDRHQRGEIWKRILGADATDELVTEYSLDTRVTSQTPPTFLVHAHDDRLSVQHSLRFYLALQKASVPAELHVYAKGGHGFGIRQRNQPVSSWRERWIQWLRAEEFLAAE